MSRTSNTGTTVADRKPKLRSTVRPPSPVDPDEVPAVKRKPPAGAFVINVDAGIPSPRPRPSKPSKPPPSKQPPPKPAPEAETKAKVKEKTVPRAADDRPSKKPPPPPTDIEEELATPTPASKAWDTALQRLPKGGFVPNLTNVNRILANAPEWRNVLAYDRFIGDIVTNREPPWSNSDYAPDLMKVGDWSETDTSRVAIWLQDNWGMPKVTTAVVGEALKVVSERISRHPIVDWLNEIAPKWDRKSRIDTFLIRLAGAEDTEYVRAVSKNFLLGAVARVFKPGSKVDSMPIFEGDQGIGKSTMIKILASEPWFMESSIDIGNKDGYAALRRKWIVELGELDSLTKAEVSRVKQFLTQTVDTYRPSYGRKTIDFHRQCVFVGTVNPEGGGYLKDITGARRFWPVKLNRKIDLKGILAEREQLWAEAVVRYRNNERWHITKPSLIAEAAKVAEERRIQHPWEAPITAFLEGQKSEIGVTIVRRQMVRGVATHELLRDVLGFYIERTGPHGETYRHVDMRRVTRGDEMQVASILKHLGWTVTHRDQSEPGRPYRYRLPDQQRDAKLAELWPNSGDVVDIKQGRRNLTPGT